MAVPMFNLDLGYIVGSIAIMENLNILAEVAGGKYITGRDQKT